MPSEPFIQRPYCSSAKTQHEIPKVGLTGCQRESEARRFDKSVQRAKTDCLGALYFSVCSLPFARCRYSQVIIAMSLIKTVAVASSARLHF